MGSEDEVGGLTGDAAPSKEDLTTEEDLPAAAAPTGLNVLIRRDGGTVTLELVGELDLATAEQVRAALAEIESQSPRRLVIDLGRLSFIDSSGIHVIISQHIRAVRQGAPRLEIRRGPEAVQRAFQIVGLEQELPFIED